MFPKIKPQKLSSNEKREPFPTPAFFSSILFFIPPGKPFPIPPGLLPGDRKGEDRNHGETQTDDRINPVDPQGFSRNGRENAQPIVIGKLQTDVPGILKHAPETEEKEPEYLAVMSTSDDRISDAVRTSLVSEYYRYCMNNEKRADFFRGGIISREHISEAIQSGNYLDYLCIRVDNRLYAESFDSSQLFEKPAGTYAVIRCPGGLESTLKGIRCLQDFIRDTGRIIVGCGYEFEILGTFTAESEHTCIKRIEIQIEG